MKRIKAHCNQQFASAHMFCLWFEGAFAKTGDPWPGWCDFVYVLGPRTVLDCHLNYGKNTLKS